MSGIFKVSQSHFEFEERYSEKCDGWDLLAIVGISPGGVISHHESCRVLR